MTPKGYKANRVTIKAMSDAAMYVVPDEFIISKNDSVNGWDVLEESSWVVTASGSGSPDDVKADLKSLARIVGANGLTYLYYRKSTGSRGNYNFTVHNFTGRPVTLGKRSLSGKYDVKDIAVVNATADQYKKKCNDKYAADKSNYKTRLLVGLAISVVVALITKGVWRFTGGGVMLVAFLYNSPTLEGEWLRKG